MTDNQRRAHDLAIALLPGTINMRISEAANNGLKDVSVDAYKEYMALYSMNLESFNRDFPDGK